MTKRIFINVLLVAIIVSFLSTALSIILFSVGRSYTDMTDQDWKTANNC